MDTVLVFDPKGKFVRSFGKEWHGGGHGIEIRKEGSEEFIYLSNTWTPELKVVKINLKGEVVWKKGRPECKEYEPRPDPKDATKTVTPAYNPTNICWLPDGGFNVGDGYGSNYMLNYDKDAKLVKVFGGSGNGKGQLRTPHGQWVDARDEGQAGAGGLRPGQRPPQPLPPGRHADRRDRIGEGGAVPGAREDPRRRTAGARPARPRQPVRQGEQTDRPPGRRRRSGARRWSAV